MYSWSWVLTQTRSPQRNFGDSSEVQHGPAAAIGPPYVYSYHMGDNEDMYAAVRAARDTPIER
jgi:alcohol dehydrogenase class IV